jgi:hypothetical protein
MKALRLPRHSTYNTIPFHKIETAQLAGRPVGGRGTHSGLQWRRSSHTFCVQHFRTAVDATSGTATGSPHQNGLEYCILPRSARRTGRQSKPDLGPVSVEQGCRCGGQVSSNVSSTSVQHPLVLQRANHASRKPICCATNSDDRQFR